MQNEERLKRVIEKAVKGGYKPTYYLGDYDFWVKNSSYYVDIFSHSFAKAYWGEGKIKIKDGMLYKGHSIDLYHDCAWKYHLQQMVLEEDKLKYLEKFL